MRAARQVEIPPRRASAERSRRLRHRYSSADSRVANSRRVAVAQRPPPRSREQSPRSTELPNRQPAVARRSSAAAARWSSHRAALARCAAARRENVDLTSNARLHASSIASSKGMARGDRRSSPPCGMTADLTAALIGDRVGLSLACAEKRMSDRYGNSVRAFEMDLRDHPH